MEFARTSRPVDVEDLSLETAFAAQPLSPATLRCLAYMADIESHTVCYLRDLLLTESHRDPRVTTFLTTWAWEEQWHGLALARVLAAHGIVAGEERIASVRSGLGFKDRLGPVLTTAGSMLARRDFVAVHMTWGALNEWSTQAGYHRLAALDPHPVLVELLDRIGRSPGTSRSTRPRRGSDWPPPLVLGAWCDSRSTSSGPPSALASYLARTRRSSSSTCSRAPRATGSWRRWTQSSNDCPGWLACHWYGGKCRAGARSRPLPEA